MIEEARIIVTHYLIQQGWQKDLAQPPLHQFNSSGLPSRLAANTPIISIDQACPIEFGSQQFHQLIQRAGLLGIGSAAFILNLTGLAFGVWQPMHSSLYFFFCSGGFQYPRPFTSCAVVKCLDRRLISSFQLYSRPMRPIPNHSSLRGRSHFTAWPMRPILNHNCHRAGAF